MASLTTVVKSLARSRSIAFSRDHLRRGWDGTFKTYAWNGYVLNYRPGTSDAKLIYSILLKGGRKSEYFPPPEFDCDKSAVRTVLDIGANVGIASIYFANMFPNAKIYAFEPHPGNYEMLRLNTDRVDRIHAFPYALGDADGELTLFDCASPTNYGGASAFDEDIDTGVSVNVPVRHAGRALGELGLDAIDVIKIDTEGAEWEILTSIDIDVLKRVKLIMGEMHGRKDFALLDYLQPHFRIGMRKTIRSRLFNFYAVPTESS